MVTLSQGYELVQVVLQLLRVISQYPHSKHVVILLLENYGKFFHTVTGSPALVVNACIGILPYRILQKIL